MSQNKTLNPTYRGLSNLQLKPSRGRGSSPIRKTIHVIESGIILKGAIKSCNEDLKIYIETGKVRSPIGIYPSSSNFNLSKEFSLNTEEFKTEQLKIGSKSVLGNISSVCVKPKSTEISVVNVKSGINAPRRKLPSFPSN